MTAECEDDEVEDNNSITLGGERVSTSDSCELLEEIVEDGDDRAPGDIGGDSSGSWI